MLLGWLLLFLAVKCLRVILVQVEVKLLSNQVVSSHPQQLHRLLFVVFQVGLELFEVFSRRVFYHFGQLRLVKVQFFVAGLFLPDLLESYFVSQSEDVIIDLHELSHYDRVLVLQHYFNESSQDKYILARILVRWVEKIFEAVQFRLLYEPLHIFLGRCLVRPFRESDKASLILTIFFPGMAPGILCRFFLGNGVRFFVVDILCLIPNLGDFMVSPEGLHI